jgi:hypothetical protein
MKIDVKVEAEFLAAILQGTKEIDHDVIDLVDPGYFSVDSYIWIVKQLKKREWKPIPFEYVDQLLLEELEDIDTRELYKNQIYYLYSKELTFVEEAEQKFRTFIAHSVMKAKVKEAFDGFDRSSRIDYLLKDVNEGYLKANGLIADKRINIVDYADHYETRMEQRKAERDNPSVNPVIKTGIPGLDFQFKIKAPMVVDFLAPFKRYKSILLNAMGFVGVLQNFNVLHVVYENTIELTENRYDALFGNISYERISTLAISPEEKARFDFMFSQMQNWGARLKILKCFPQVTTIADIEEEIEKLKHREGFVPDVVIIDYLNIVKPSEDIREERLQQQKIVWDMKHLADYYNVPVFTASQAKMEANKVDRMDVTHRGKSIDISQGINLSIAIDQTKEEREEGILVLSPLFSREDRILIPEVVCETDLSKMTICHSHRDMWECAKKLHGYNSDF